MLRGKVGKAGARCCRAHIPKETVQILFYVSTCIKPPPACMEHVHCVGPCVES